MQTNCVMSGLKANEIHAVRKMQCTYGNGVALTKQCPWDDWHQFFVYEITWCTQQDNDLYQDSLVRKCLNGSSVITDHSLGSAKPDISIPVFSDAKYHVTGCYADGCLSIIPVQ